MTLNQKVIIAYIFKEKTITVDQAVELIGANIYANKNKHVSATLGRMVKSGIIKRKSRGVFEMPYKVNLV